MLCIVPCEWFDHYTTGLPSSRQLSVGILTFRWAGASVFRSRIWDKIRIEGGVAFVSIAVETIEILVAAIDLNCCKCSVVRRDRCPLDNFPTHDLWS